MPQQNQHLQRRGYKSAAFPSAQTTPVRGEDQRTNCARSKEKGPQRDEPIVNIDSEANSLWVFFSSSYEETNLCLTRFIESFAEHIVQPRGQHTRYEAVDESPDQPNDRTYVCHTVTKIIIT